MSAPASVIWWAPPGASGPLHVHDDENGSDRAVCGADLTKGRQCGFRPVDSLRCPSCHAVALTAEMGAS